jgi:short-subunit dehydrogenase
MPKTILITGASSGLGKHLALEYAKAGNRLFLSGRNKAKLKEVCSLCQKSGAKAEVAIIDVRKKDEMREWIDGIGNKCKLDLVIANAGISAGTSDGIESDEQIEEIFDVNINGVLNTVNSAMKVMQKQGSGQIGIISSLAGFRGLPSSPAYSASKSAVRVYAEGLRGCAAKIGIKVNAICPGYIKTPMTDKNNFPMPFLMSAQKASKIIRIGLEKNKSRIAFPFQFYFIVWLMALLSTKITDPIFSKLPAKSSL